MAKAKLQRNFQASAKQAVAQKQALASAQQFIARYRFNPNLFAKEVLNQTLDPWQLEANDMVADYVRDCFGLPILLQSARPAKNWFTVKAMHGPGKTFWVAIIALWFGSVFPGARIPCVAPKLDQLKTRLWLEMKNIRAKAIPDFQAMTKDIGSVHLRWFEDDTWTAFGQTATQAENLAGLHNDYLLVLVDEASGVREDLFPVIEGALSTGKVVMLVMISNPSKKTGTFAMSWLSPRISPQYCQIKIDLAKAPRVDKAWVARMVEKYGANSPIVKIRAYGEFADDSPQQLIATQWIMDAAAREYSDTHRVRLRVSGDIADGGEDETVIVVGEEHEFGRTLLKITRHSFQPSVAVVEAADVMEARFNAFGGRKGVDEMVVDALGVGAGTAGVLLKRGHRVIRHVGGESATDKTKWRNRRVQNYCTMRDAYREGRVSVASDCFEDPSDAEEMLAQIASIELDPGSDKVEDLVTKEQMKTKGLKSPDIADSISEQWTAAQGAGQGIMDWVRQAADDQHKQSEQAAAAPVVVTTHTGIDALMRQHT